MVNGDAGKGDAYRPVVRAKWDRNYKRIFGPRTRPPARPSKEPKAKAD